MKHLKYVFAAFGVAIPFLFIQPAAADDSGWRIVVGSDGHVGVDFYAYGKGGAAHPRYGKRYGHPGRYGYRGRHHYPRYGYSGRGYNRGYNRGYRRGYRDGAFGGHGGYKSGYAYRPCQRVYKSGYWRGRPAQVGGTMCYDEYGNGYIVRGSRYLMHYY